MKKNSVLILSLFLLLALILASSVSGENIAVSDTTPTIHLKIGSFAPAAGETLALPAHLTLEEAPSAGAGAYYIVQFRGPVQDAWKNAVAQLGGSFFGYIPDYAFKVKMTGQTATAVSRLPQVAWVGLYQPAFRLSPAIAAQETALYKVRLEQGSDLAGNRAAIEATGAAISRQDGRFLIVSADGPQLNALAHISDVAWIEPYVLYEKHNEYGAGVIIGGNAANANGYDGSTQTVAVADTGIGGGSANTAHADIPAGRVVAVHNWPGSSGGCFTSITDDGAVDVDSGHGTHVAGSVLSDGGQNGQGKGSAPAASLVFQSTENWATVSSFCQIFGGYPPAAYFLTGLPDDLNNLYQQAYNDGARIHSNSWGAALAGDYTADSANTDAFMWNNRDMLITFSAGNSGVDTNNNGVVDNDSIGSPATAKNVLTVGASENDRQGHWECDTGLGYVSHDSYQSGQTCSSMGGQNILGTAGQRWGFTAEPLNSDITAGNANQMAPFSSRGPTDDGRIKPDIVAPGTWILSGYSDLYQEGYGDPVNPQNNAYQVDGWGMPVNGSYKYFGGTSMSNPIAAGGAAVVRDYYQKAHGHAASAALTKAALINTAVDLLDENNDGANDNDYPIPNVHEGWGRIDLAAATSGSQQWVDNSTGLATGGTANYQFNVATSGSAFKVTLVWTDYPSTESAGTNLVNNLNLVVTAPGGATYRGNVFSGGWSQTGGSADNVNNVENVYVQSAAAGTWTVQVSGANVPNGPQPFALVVDGQFGAPPPTDTPAPPTPTNTPAPPTNTPTPTNTPPPPTPTNTPAPSSSMHVGDLDGSSANQGGGSWQATVTILVVDNNGTPVSNATVSGSWSNGTSGSGNCVTNGSGVCSISRGSIHNRNKSVLFTVTNVSHASLSYNPAANTDPDGDSNGTVIEVFK